MFIDGPWEALMFNTYTWGVGGPEEGPYVFKNMLKEIGSKNMFIKIRF